MVTVAGRQIPASGVHDIADAVARSGVRVPNGRLWSILRDRVLKDNIDAATILLNGTAAALTTHVHAGDLITFVPGHDQVEKTTTVSVPVYLDATAAALYTSSRAGVASAVKGALSGVVSSSTLITAPTVGRLRAAAQLSFTFDDGPAATYTSQVLALLAQYHAAAVFCVIGIDATKHPEFVRQEVAAGHRLCDHTQDHPLNLPSLGATRIDWEIRTGEQSIMAASGGVAPLYFRAPGGAWSSTVIASAQHLQLSPLKWTVDPRDWSRPGTPEIVLSILNQLRPNGIILMHDGGGDRSQTVAALRVLLPELIAAGWTPVFPPRS